MKINNNIYNKKKNIMKKSVKNYTEFENKIINNDKSLFESDSAYSEENMNKDEIQTVENKEEPPKKIKNPNKLSISTINELTDRLEDEYHAYYLYINAHNWCVDKNYTKAAKFFKEESIKELEHADTMMKYLLDWNSKPTIRKTETNYDFKDLVEIIEKVYEIEYNLLKKYNVSSSKIFNDGDIATFDFLSYFRNIQIGEVTEYSDLLNALLLINTNDKYKLLQFQNIYF